MARALLWLLLIGLVGDANSQEPPPYRISVNVDFVVLHATVRDGNGSFAPGLRQEDFEVYEDGVRQSIRLFRHEDTPVAVGLVVDHSGSMRHKLEAVVAAARTFADSSSPEDQMFVVNFNENVSLGLPDAHQFTHRADEFALAVNHPATGKTALYDAIMEANTRLKAASLDKKVLIVISDGSDNASRHRLAQVLGKAYESSTVVYTVGIFDQGDPDGNPGVLRRLAQATGGEAYFPRQIKEVITICERIASDIRNQYMLGYVPGGTVQPGRYRVIRVAARSAGKKLFVRSRAGYLVERAK